VPRLSWSPDGTRIAFWVIELLGADILTQTGVATIHVLDVVTENITSYCGFVTNEHTPNPPRLIWSPDSTHIAFAGNVPGDERGYLLLALNIETGVFTELSEGVFPILGGTDLIAWGLPPV
jgi:Tol biopolymer transport system component